MEIKAGDKVRILSGTDEVDPNAGQIVPVVAVSATRDGKPVYLVQVSNQTLAYFDGEIELVEE